MGCTFSDHRRDKNVRSFRVYNVDEQEVKQNRGRLEIRDAELVLYQKGKEPIRWPLMWLRRYGCDDEVFSFESGRRCATGTGIFAFKCSHAETLFNLVHENLQRAGDDDQRAQQHLSVQHQTAIPQNTHNIPAHTRPQDSIHRITYSQTLQPSRGGGMSYTVRSNSNENVFDSGSQNGSAHLYVNGQVAQMKDSDQHQYINTEPPRSVSAALHMDETAALVDFLHNPPMNYVTIEAVDSQASMENLLDETGQGAVHNMDKRGLPPADGNHRLSQPSAVSGGVRGEASRLSMPNDLTAAASQQETDSVLQSADSDVFLDASSPDGQASANYVNLDIEDSTAAYGGASGAVPPPPLSLILPPTHEVPPTSHHHHHHANLAVQSPKMVNYILIDHKTQASDNPAVAGVVSGSAVGNASNSPISPTSCASFPESPSRKTRSYATIDFDRTQALSNTTRPVTQDEEGSRKTRHNSSISDMPS